jgi:hypothetical protein
MSSCIMDMPPRQTAVRMRPPTRPPSTPGRGGRPQSSSMRRDTSPTPRPGSASVPSLIPPTHPTRRPSTPAKDAPPPPPVLSADERVAHTATEILSTLPTALLRAEAGPDAFVVVVATGLPACMSTVLAHEMDKYNRLLEVVRSSVTELSRAMAGQVAMSESTERVYSALLNNKVRQTRARVCVCVLCLLLTLSVCARGVQVPALWHTVSYPSLKPLGSWMKDVIARVEFMRTWLVKGPPSAFPLSSFFFPQVRHCASPVGSRCAPPTLTLPYACTGLSHGSVASARSQVPHPHQRAGVHVVAHLRCVAAGPSASC